MGGGASIEALSEEEKARIEALQALDPEKQKMLAFTAMKDTLSLAAKYACTEGSLKGTWERPEYMIPVPRQGDFDWLAEGVGKVPLVGKKLAEEILKVPASISASMIDAAVTISSDPSALAVFADVISRLRPADDMVELCKAGGGAFADSLVRTASAELASLLLPVVAKTLEGHDITKAWQGAIATYNAAAGKLPGVDPMDFDLNTYVMEQILGTLGLLLRAKEAATRARPGDDATDAVKQIFGAGQPDPAELIMSLVLVPKGDPRQFVLGSEKADGFSPFSRAS